MSVAALYGGATSSPLRSDFDDETGIADRSTRIGETIVQVAGCATGNPQPLLCTREK